MPEEVVLARCDGKQLYLVLTNAPMLTGANHTLRIVIAVAKARRMERVMADKVEGGRL